MSREHTPTPSEEGSGHFDEETDPVDPMEEQVTDKAREKAEYETLDRLVQRTAVARRELQFLFQEIEEEKTRTA